MRFQFETDGLRLTGSTEVGLVLEMGSVSQNIGADAAAVLAQAFAIAARLPGLPQSIKLTPAAAPTAAAARPAPATTEVAQKAPKAVAAPAGATATHGTTHRDSGLLLLDGEAVKRGPRATTERAGPRKGRRRGRPPGSGKRAATAALAAAPAPKVSSKKTAATIPPTNRRGRGRPPSGRSGRSRKPVVDSMAGWMRANSGAQPVEALVKAAVAGGWTAAKDVGHAIRAALSRNADLFARQADGTFILRGSLPPGKVVRRQRKDRSK